MGQDKTDHINNAIKIIEKKITEKQIELKPSITGVQITLTPEEIANLQIKSPA